MLERGYGKQLKPLLDTGRKTVTAEYSPVPQYQIYYWISLATVLKLSVNKGPVLHRIISNPATALDAGLFYQQISRKIGLEEDPHVPEIQQFVGRYLWQSNGRTIRFAIDAHDLPDIVSTEALNWSDLYFKANKWHSRDYADKVVPIVNGNGFLREKHLKKLRAMRTYAKRNDFIFISRIWGGVEHNVRLFETLAKLSCRKRLVAIFVHGTTGEMETQEAIRRLERVGVVCTFNTLPAGKLWKEMASSRIVMLRAGKHLCIPWRMIDLLCMGACIVTDADFKPGWPVRLQSGQHFLSADLNRPDDTSPAAIQEYEKVNRAVEQLLADRPLRHRLRKNSEAYFDRNAAPSQVGRYIMDRIENRLC